LTTTKLFEQGFTPTATLAADRNAQLALLPGSSSAYAFTLFPMSITDLDEVNLYSTVTGAIGNSKRTYQLNYLMTAGYTETLASHLYLVPRLDSSKFPNGVTTLGINQSPTQ
jgi:hypothetical protein